MQATQPILKKLACCFCSSFRLNFKIIIEQSLPMTKTVPNRNVDTDNIVHIEHIYLDVNCLYSISYFQYILVKTVCPSILQTKRRRPVKA